MELFKITCVTCRARLSVRDAALVGQIIGCPRCGMMVHVIAPVGAAMVAPSAVEAVIPAAEESPAFEEAAIEAASAPQGPAPSVGDESVPTFDDAVTTNASPVEAVVTPAIASAAAAEALPGSWSSFKLAAVLAGGGVLGSAVVAIGLTLLNHAEPELVAAAPPKTAAPKIEAPETGAPSHAVQPPSALPADADPPPAAEAPAEEEGLMPLKIPEASAAVTKPTAAAVVDEVAKSPPASELPADTSEAPAPAPAPPQIRIDPLDIDPEGLDLSSLYNPPAKDPLAESQLPAEVEAPPSVPPAEPPPQELPVQEEKRAVQRDDRGVGAPSNEAALLARRLPAVELKKAPLCRVLDLAVQLSGLPVSVAPQDLRMAAASAGSATSFAAKDATIEQLLAAAGEPLRLKPVVDGKQILLKPLREAERRTVDYAVDDLAGNAEQVAQLAAWVPQLAAPEAWDGDATIKIVGTKLRVDAPVTVQYEVLFLLERYRLTRELPARSKYPSSLLGPGAFHASIGERLSAPAVFTFSDFAPLREVLRYWQEEMGVAVLVDWPALSTERLWPKSRIACSAANQPWSEAMDSVLAPLGLGWRAVDHRTIEITTAAKVATEPMLELYRVAEGTVGNGEDLVARVRGLTDRPDANGIVFDAASRLLLVRQPAAVQRKVVRELAGILIAPSAAAH